MTRIQLSFCAQLCLHTQPVQLNAPKCLVISVVILLKKCTQSGRVNIETFAPHSTQLEEHQRQEERERKETKSDWQTKLFQKKDEGWQYAQPLEVQ